MTDSTAWLEAARLAAVANVERLFANPAEIGAFMTARLDEDCDVAERNSDGNGLDGGFPDYRTHKDSDTEAADIYIEHFNPARVLAEVTIKRDRLDRYLEYRKTLQDVYANPGKYTFDQQLVAGIAAGLYEVLVRTDLTVYDQHPGFKPEWRLP